MARKILIIEDHPGTRHLISELLTMNNYNFIMACDGPSALEMLKKEKPGLILLDLMMPEMGGLEVLKKLKADPKTREIPVVIVSVKDSPSDIRAGKQAGAIEYIAKPFEPDELIDAVKKYIKN